MTAPGNAKVAIVMGSQSDWETMHLRRRSARRARRRHRCPHRLRASHARPDGDLPSAQPKPKVRGDHRRRRRRGASARHDRGADPCPRIGRAGAIARAVGRGQPALDRADARGRPSGHAGHRRRRAPPTPACWPRRSSPTTTPGCRSGCRTGARRAAPRWLSARSTDAEARRHDRHSGRRPAWPDDGACGAIGLSLHRLCARRRHGRSAGVRRFLRQRLGRHGALAAFAAQCDVVTWEFENVPVATAQAMPGDRIFPHPRALETAQDRLAEKRFVEGLGGGAGSLCADRSMQISKWRWSGSARPASSRPAVTAMTARASGGSVRRAMPRR